MIRFARSMLIGPRSWLQCTGFPASFEHAVHGLPGAPCAGRQLDRTQARSGRSATEIR
jgi:hypothetical protein